MSDGGHDKDAATWESVRSRLLREKERVVAEIHGYPPPIAGCDAQYQYLTERRHLVARELARLDAAEGQGDGALDEFIRSSAILDGAPDAGG